MSKVSNFIVFGLEAVLAWVLLETAAANVKAGKASNADILIYTGITEKGKELNLQSVEAKRVTINIQLPEVQEQKLDPFMTIQPPRKPV